MVHFHSVWKSLKKVSILNLASEASLVYSNSKTLIWMQEMMADELPLHWLAVMDTKIELARFARKWCKMRHFWRFQTMWILWFLNKNRRTETIKRVYRNGFSLGSRAESKRCREKRRPRGYCIQQDVYPWKILSYRHPSYFYSCTISIFIIKCVRK